MFFLWNFRTISMIFLHYKEALVSTGSSYLLSSSYLLVLQISKFFMKINKQVKFRSETKGSMGCYNLRMVRTRDQSQQ
uniref:Uncharacterized protein n=1 Tax=Arundo donax TaxID=35708 RepID=A0A0A9DTP1_ARUDO